MFNTITEEGMKCHAMKKQKVKTKHTYKTKIDTPFRDFFPHFDGFACIHEIVMCHFTSFVLL